MSELIYGSKVSLFIAFFVSLVSGIIGTALGLLSGYFEWVGFFIMRIVDAFLAIPRLPLMIVIVVFIRSGIRDQGSGIKHQASGISYLYSYYLDGHSLPALYAQRCYHSEISYQTCENGGCFRRAGIVYYVHDTFTYVYMALSLFYQNVHPLNHLKLSLYLYAMG